MTLGQQQRRFSRMIAEFILHAYEQGYELTFGDAWRNTDLLKCPTCKSPHSYQEMLVKNGKSKTLASKHSDRLAVDFNVFKDGQLCDAEGIRPLGVYWESIGGRWGGRFGDDPATRKIEGWDAGHFEFGDGLDRRHPISGVE